MNNYYIVFQMKNYQLTIDHKPNEEYFFRITIDAMNFSGAEKKFKTQTKNKFGSVKARIIHSIKLK